MLEVGTTNQKINQASHPLSTQTPFLIGVQPQPPDRSREGVSAKTRSASETITSGVNMVTKRTAISATKGSGPGVA